MSHPCPFSRIFFGLIVALIFFGCNKSTEYTGGQKSTSVSNDVTAADLSKCKIRRIYQDVGDVRQGALFSYNNAGNPFSVIYANNGTGNPNHYFIYDSRNRLREYQKRYGDFVVERHQYGYDTNNHIVRDTLTSREAGVFYIAISTIEYDPSGRVIKETIVNTLNDSGPLDPVRRPTYTYDSRGNLAVANWKSSSYDSKVNPLQQSSVFQFIFRNYSVNNAAVQPKYNSLGEPLSAHPSNDYFFNSGVTYQIVYDCQ